MAADMTQTLAPPNLPGCANIVDALIEERAIALRARPRLWGAVRRVGYPILGYRKAVRMAERLRPMGGRYAINWMSAQLGLDLDVRGVEHVPESGPVVVVANHPGGIADGVAVWDALVMRRPDLAFFANRDALRVCPGLADQIIPVEWREEERTRAKNRETLRAAAEAFRAGRCVVIFPAGRIAQWRWSLFGLEEPAWAATAVSMARRYGAAVTPLGVRSRMSALYYGLAQVSDELKNITVFHELLRARGARYRLRFGPPVPDDVLPSDPEAATARLRRCAVALSG